MPGARQRWNDISGNTVGGMIINALGGYLSGGPGARSVDQSLNSLCQNASPSMDALVNMWMTGYLPNNQFIQFAGLHGADLGTEGAGKVGLAYQDVWVKYVKSQYWRPDAGSIMQALRRNLFDAAAIPVLKQKYKVDSAVEEHMGSMFEQQLDPGMVLTLYNRQFVTQDDALTYLINYGGYDDDKLKAFEEVARFIPPVGDLINMTVKGALDDNQINRLELNAEIEETNEAREWAERQGIGFCRMYTNGVQTDSIDWFDRYWYTHWNLPAPGQTIQFAQRFRPNRMFRYDKQVPGIKPFNADDLDFYMKANDYTPPVRKWLAGIGLSLPRLVDTRNQYFYGIIDRKELIELQIDRGYTETDAETFAQLADKQKEVWKYKHRVQLFDSFDRKFYNEVIAAFRTGNMGEQDFVATIFGILKDESAADAVVKAEILRAQTAVAKASVAAIKSSFFTGEVSLADAESRLRQAGIDPSAVQHYIDVWELKMTMPRKVRTASQLIGDFVHGFLSIQNLSVRLQNLGYSQRDTSLALADALRQQAVFQEKEAAKEEKKKGKGKGGTTDAGERWLTPDRIIKWQSNQQLTPEQAAGLLAELDVAPEFIPVFMGGKLSG